jgi:hypothetical protein
MLSPRKPWISPEDYLEIDRTSDLQPDIPYRTLYRLTDVPEQYTD